jgi:hypothetical protein|tara:strand:+ start:770 stop:2083 length:1314 start_codon:yes stop_codon:yes gene_type:complete
MKIYFFLCLLIFSCKSISDQTTNRDEYVSNQNDIIISRADYFNKLEGFWLAQCIANMTGLVTEMDKIGNIGEIKTGNFYTREDWGKPDIPSIFNSEPSNLSPTIDFVFEQDGLWPADDDTDIEYMYQELLIKNKTSFLTGEQIKEGWIKHIRSEEENFLWVSNQKAFDLMKEGIIPPETSNPKNNPEYEMIDAQLTTEIFGFYAPSRPDIAIEMAKLPIQTTARYNAQWISEFYVSMYSLASMVDKKKSMKENIMWMADESRKVLPADSYSAKMYDFVKSEYLNGVKWESIRDKVYQRYQVEGLDGYDLTSKNIYCNACFAAGINFAASLVSLFCGEGDYIETIKIGSLAGWDSDNPTATWGGLLGFMVGKDGVEKIFNRSFSDKYNIHRTRQNFDRGIDNFSNMAKKGLLIVDRVVANELNGYVDFENNVWHIPSK